mgnify:CR=1 FL=1
MVDDPLQTEDFRRCAEFHGHICPGLTIGYLAARAGLGKLRARRSTEDELVAELESNACGADAIQMLTGCTFGKGNLVYKDRGKQAFTFLDRSSGQGVRAAMRAVVFAPVSRPSDFFAKMRRHAATTEEKNQFWDLQREKSRELLEVSFEDLFSIQWVSRRPMPVQADIDCSEPCDGCNEPTMAAKLQRTGLGNYCLDCASHAL